MLSDDQLNELEANLLKVKLAGAMDERARTIKIITDLIMDTELVMLQYPEDANQDRVETSVAALKTVATLIATAPFS